MMKRLGVVVSCWVLAGTWLALAKSPGESPGASPGASGQIDELVGQALQEVGVAPNPPIADEVFLRRVYLDVIGRVPTIEEARRFLESRDPGKRAALIDELLDSEGYVSHFFNYWADILRVNESVNNNRLPTAAYGLWLKQALRGNMPYDEFVSELVTARGFIWENGAVGYYQRDRGMQLDNMSNTVRIFLGTRLECAQCHNHPFDKWTQMDYYHMAAFSYGMDAREYETANRRAFAEYSRELQREAQKDQKDREASRDERKDRRKADAYQASRQVVSDLYNPIRYVAASERNQEVRLPHDYQYDDAKPKQEIDPAAMFEPRIDLADGKSRIEAYADWLTSPDNPRFTLVIANRLWKKVMGAGLIEPVDELMDDTQASNPALMAFLAQRMTELDYDMKAFLRDILNSQVYQREADDEEILAGMPYHFPGPKLRRMSAEQLWDSLVTLAIPEPDYYMPELDRRLALIDQARQLYDNLEDRSTDEFIDLVKKGTAIYAVNFQRTEELSREYAELRADKTKEDEAKAVGRELGALRNDSRNKLQKLALDDGELPRGDPETLMGVFGIDGEQMSREEIVTKLPAAPKPEADPGLSKEQRKRFYDEIGREIQAWQQAGSQLMRASELPSPAPRGHFLREFGQSDREVIENASDAASVPQALALLNGPIAETLGNRNSVLRQNFEKSASPEEKIRTIYMGMLSRYPSDSEMDLLLGEVERSGEDGYENILWALLNSQNFRFVQ